MLETMLDGGRQQAAGNLAGRANAAGRLTWSLALWFVYLVGRCFYVLPSGSPQPADLLVGPLLIFCLSQRSFLDRRARAAGVAGVVFLGWTWVISAFQYPLTGDIQIIEAPIFYSYNVVVFYVILCLYFETGERFMLVTRLALLVILYLEAAVVATGVGRALSVRAMGTVNDPNQLAYLVLLASAGYLALKAEERLFTIDLSAIAAAGFVIVQTQSRSATLGFVMLLVITSVLFRTSRLQKGALALAFLPLLATALAFGHNPFESLSASGLRSYFDRFSLEHGVNDTAAGRGYDRVIQYPAYLLFGAGEGANIVRFGNDQEVHSTWLNLLFCYGIVGLVLFLTFIYQILRPDIKRAGLFFAVPALYGVSTYGARNAGFWIFLGLLMAAGLARKSSARAMAKARRRGRGAEAIPLPPPRQQERATPQYPAAKSGDG